MILHQLQATYQPHQDRILLRLNTTENEELRVWLTRRMMKGLLPNLVQITTELVNRQPQPASHDSTKPHALANFKKQEALALADFSKPFESNSPVLPLGGNPLLISSVHMTPLQAGQLRLGFEEAADGANPARSFSVTMTQPVFHSLLHLLESTLTATQWNLSTAPEITKLTPDALDNFASEAPPAYLN